MRYFKPAPFLNIGRDFAWKKVDENIEVLHDTNSGEIAGECYDYNHGIWSAQTLNDRIPRKFVSLEDAKRWVWSSVTGGDASRSAD